VVFYKGLQMTEKYITFPPRKPATREEFFTGITSALFQTTATLKKITPVVDAENRYLERVACEMGIQHRHIKSDVKIIN